MDRSAKLDGQGDFFCRGLSDSEERGERKTLKAGKRAMTFEGLIGLHLRRSKRINGAEGGP